MISLFDVLKQTKYLGLLEKSIKNNDEVTEIFKSQHLDNIESFLKTTEIPDGWYVLVGATNIDPILSKTTVDFYVYSNFFNLKLRKLLMVFSVESYIFKGMCEIYIKDLSIHFKNLVFKTESYLTKTKSYLSKEEFIDIIRVYEIIFKQQKKEELK